MSPEEIRQIANAADERVKDSFLVVQQLRSRRLPRLPSKREWRGQTRLTLRDQLWRRQVPFRQLKLRQLDGALKRYSKERIRYERLVDSNRRKLDKLDRAPDKFRAGWRRKLNQLLNAKTQELKAYEKALTAAERVSARFDSWKLTHDYTFRADRKRPVAVAKLKMRLAYLALPQNRQTLASQQLQLSTARDHFQSAKHGFQNYRNAVIGPAARSLLKGDLVGAMTDATHVPSAQILGNAAQRVPENRANALSQPSRTPRSRFPIDESAPPGLSRQPINPYVYAPAFRPTQLQAVPTHQETPPATQDLTPPLRLSSEAPRRSAKLTKPRVT